VTAPAHAGPVLGDPHSSPARKLVRRWWFSLAMGLSIALVLAFLTLPVVAIFVNVSPGRLLSSLGGSQSLQALRLSVETSAIAVAAVVLVGTPGAYLLATRRFRGHALVLTLIELPLVLPPAVAGIGLLASLGPHGLLGGALATAHIQLVLQTAGVVVALAFVSAPLYLRQAHAAFAAIEREHIEGALALGIRRPAVFLHIAVPIARPALLAGLALAWGRALGEFGATLMFAGSFQGVTQTIPLAIYDEFSSDFPAALALSALLVVVSAAVLLTIKLLWTPSRPPI
jgi:molybdate transport system permease protein